MVQKMNKDDLRFLKQLAKFYVDMDVMGKSDQEELEEEAMIRIIEIMKSDKTIEDYFEKIMKEYREYLTSDQDMDISKLEIFDP